jgi:hypothetical protein
LRRDRYRTENGTRAVAPLRSRRVHRCPSFRGDDCSLIIHVSAVCPVVYTAGLYRCRHLRTSPCPACNATRAPPPDGSINIERGSASTHVQTTTALVFSSQTRRYAAPPQSFVQPRDSDFGFVTVFTTVLWTVSQSNNWYRVGDRTEKCPRAEKKNTRCNTSNSTV